jgi:hypothetical protein
MSMVYCDRRGRIGFTSAWREPDGMMPIARGKLSDLRDAVEGSARLAYDGYTWLVPGVPEAGADDEMAMDAVLVFAADLALRPGCRSLLKVSTDDVQRIKECWPQRVMAAMAEVLS